MIEFEWLGHGSFAIKGPPLIYINPWRISRSVFHADLILVGHNHYEHCSLADIEKLRGPDTVIIGNEGVTQEIPGAVMLRPWQSYTLDRANVKAVPAYSPNDLRHAPEDGGLGFVISLNYYDIYYAGDTQIIPEMRLIKPDIAMLPIDGNGTLTVAEAAEVVRQMRPRYTYAINWGPTAEGATRVDALTLKSLVADHTQMIIP